jgi:hypothetical protein
MMNLYFDLSLWLAALYLFPTAIRNIHGLNFEVDALAEWLRRWPAKPMGYARVGSNPTGVVLFGNYFFSMCAALII